ncbi:MAG: hypothetical protein HY647_09085, partial [Acidobacteria bacterium]|nr:hypothetical protein [Acidobacteriota bacterium]
AFAFEVNIANDVTGIGRIAEPPVFDFSAEFGSSRLQSLLNMGWLLQYPPDPSAVFLRGVDSTLSILGQEAGHRFLVFVTFNDPEGPSNSTALLGRDLQHWSFLFNSDASVMEGNRIRDNGNGTFTTIGAVEHYNEIDQYLMGLRPPNEVGPSFLVKEPSPPISPARAPAVPNSVSFAGRRANVLLEQIIAANGPRVPNSLIAPKSFRFAFVLVGSQGSAPNPEQIARLDTIRRAWEPYFSQATSGRGTAHTSLVRGLRLVPSPLGLFSGMQREAQLELLATASSDVRITLTNSNPSAAQVPSSVVIPAGARSVSFAITGLGPGVSTISASAPGFETARGVVGVQSGLATSELSLTVAGGDRQVGEPGSSLPQSLKVALRDRNQIPFEGVHVEFAVTQGAATLSPLSALTDGQGTASVAVTLGEATGLITVVATVPGTSLGAQFSVFSLIKPQVPQAGVVSGASFAPSPAPLAPGSIISIFGTNLAATTASASALPLPRALGSTSVEINGGAVPLFYVSPTQINAQLPGELSGTTAFLRVRNGLSTSEPISIALASVAPAIFSKDSTGRGEGAITFAASQLVVSAERPARAGDFVQIFATGLGPVSPTVPSGQPPPLEPLSRTTFLVTATMGGVPATVVFAGLAPDLVGVYQVNAQVPEGVSGTVPLVLTVGGIASNEVTLEVR